MKKVFLTLDKLLVLIGDGINVTNKLRFRPKVYVYRNSLERLLWSRSPVFESRCGNN